MKLTPVPQSTNPETAALFKKLEAMLGDYACFKSHTGTHFRYATKNGVHLTINLMLEYRVYAQALGMVVRLSSIGSTRAFESHFKYRSQPDHGGYFRLNKFSVVLARGSRAECLKQLTESGVIKTVSSWLDANVSATGATPVPRLVQTLAAVWLATIGVDPQGLPATQPVVSAETLEAAFDSSYAGNKSDDEAAKANPKQYVNTDASDDEYAPDTDPSNGADALLDEDPAYEEN